LAVLCDKVNNIVIALCKEGNVEQIYVKIVSRSEGYKKIKEKYNLMCS
jgi:hypothetical protein